MEDHPLTRARQRLGWTQTRLATESGVSKDVIANVETCRKPTTTDKLVRLLDAAQATDAERLEALKTTANTTESRGVP